MTTRVKEIKDSVVAVLTFLIRPSIFLVLGLFVGYMLGFADAFRDFDTLGDKVYRTVYKIHPAAVSQGIYQRGSVLRDTIHARSGINEIPPN